MAENKMEQVAKLLGLELGEVFNIKNQRRDYKLTKTGLKYFNNTDGFWESSFSLESLIIGTLEIIKLPKSILDKQEKEYLLNVIKPKNIINRLCYIEKRQGIFGICADMEFINIGLDDESFFITIFQKRHNVQRYGRI